MTTVLAILSIAFTLADILRGGSRITITRTERGGSVWVHISWLLTIAVILGVIALVTA
jgi:hypothetical protein